MRSPRFGRPTRRSWAARTTPGGLNAQSLQLTLRRVDRAFQHFFRKCADPEFTGNPGFPRFKSLSRYNGWTYNHQSGWRIAPQGEDRPVASTGA